MRINVQNSNRRVNLSDTLKLLCVQAARLDRRRGILKLSLFLLLFLPGITVKSQVLLNSDSAQIKRQILSQGGRLRISALEDGQEFPGYYHILIFKFSESSIRKNGIHLTTFFLTTKNKCFAYTVSYADTSYIAKLKNTFNQTNSGMKQVGNRLMWINPVKKYIVKVLPNIPVNGKIAPVFDLEIKNE